MTENLRLDRQLRIPAWRQEVLTKARIGVVGDSPRLVSLFLLGTAALGINQVVVIAPVLDPGLLQLARSLNPAWRLWHLPGYLTQPVVLELLRPCRIWVNISRYSLADKLLFNAAESWQKPVVRGLPLEANGQVGWRLFVYLPGREWEEVREVLAPEPLPVSRTAPDGAPDIILAGILLEETKKLLFQEEPLPCLVQYQQAAPPKPWPGRIGVVGAGALGNFVALGLAWAGFTTVTFFDPDQVELTNLNRQIFFGAAVGQPKAQALAQSLKDFGVREATGRVEYFSPQTEVGEFDLVFDCVDNFASRLAISRRCEAAGVPLVSGGTDYARGQVVFYHPGKQPQTVAELLDLERLAGEARAARRRAACIYQPEPAVIMTNQIIGGFMVEVGRRLLAGQQGFQVFYDAAAPCRFELIEPESC